MQLNRLIHGDCMEVMAGIPDKYFELCITDFPYGINENYDEFNDTAENVKELIDKAMPEILSVSKRALITCSTRQITWYPESTWILNWFNKAGNGCNPWGFTCWQPILAYGKDPYLENKKGSRPDFIEHSEASPKNGHPCPKPLQFWKKLLTRGSVHKTDKILDPFAGSFTTAIACEDLGYNDYTCIELSKQYYDLGVNRLNEYKSQTNLFEPAI